MIKCPYCKEIIPDDSWFCDHCGKEMKWCPECRIPKRGTECALCGEKLSDPASYFGADKNEGAGQGPGSQKASASCLEGNGWKLMLAEGQFGRCGGIWPELSSVQYVSGNHGQIRRQGEGWQICDSGSTNGTFINGSRTAPGTWTDINIGDKIKIATVTFNVN